MTSGLPDRTASLDAVSRPTFHPTRRDVVTTFALALAVPMFGLPTPTKAQSMTDNVLSARIRILEDRAALKNLVDTFSVLADRKDVAAQMPLFTEDATVSSYNDGKPGSTFTGHKEIGDAFSGYLALFETVYHINGQQTVEINGDTAKGVSYCLVMLIEAKDGKRIRHTSGVTYDDEYVRRGTEWLIAKRTSHFTWRDAEEMAPTTP